MKYSSSFKAIALVTFSVLSIHVVNAQVFVPSNASIVVAPDFSEAESVFTLYSTTANLIFTAANLIKLNSRDIEDLKTVAALSFITGSIQTIGGAVMIRDNAGMGILNLAVGTTTCIIGRKRLLRKNKNETVSLVPICFPIQNELALGCNLYISIK